MDHVLEILHSLRAPVRELFAPFKERSVDPVPGVQTLKYPVRLVPERECARGIRHAHRVEGMRILLLRGVEGVGRLVPDAECPGLFRPPPAEPVERVIRDHMGVVTLRGLVPCPVDVPFRVKVFPLPPVRDEPVKPRARGIIRLPHVPLADVGGLVAGPLQPPRPMFQRGG